MPASTTIAGQTMVESSPLSGTRVNEPNPNFLKTSTTLSLDEKTQRDIERRRALEAARRERIFNPKVRQFGLDLDTLDQQCQEKNRRKQIEKEIDSLYDKQTLAVTEHLKRQDIALRQQRREMETSTKNFSLTYLKKPDPIPKTTEPVQIPTNVASMQTWDGEDRSFLERKKYQQHQMKDWIQQQVFEKRLIDQEEKHRQSQWEDQQKATRNALNAIEVQHTRQRRDMEVARVQQNEHLAAEVARRALAFKMEQEEKNTQEIEKNLTDPFLSDGRLDLIGYTDHPEILGDKVCIGTRRANFKGMTRLERDEILKENLCHWKLKHSNAVREIDEEKAWAIQNEAQRRHLVTMNADHQKQRRHNNMNTQDVNKSLAAEQIYRKAYFDKEVYTNYPTEKYFSYFGTTTR